AFDTRQRDGAGVAAGAAGPGGGDRRWQGVVDFENAGGGRCVPGGGDRQRGVGRGRATSGGAEGHVRRRGDGERQGGRRGRRRGRGWRCGGGGGSRGRW